MFNNVYNDNLMFLRWPISYLGTLLSSDCGVEYVMVTDVATHDPLG